jgi:hypothetical protein
LEETGVPFGIPSARGFPDPTSDVGKCRPFSQSDNDSTPLTPYQSSEDEILRLLSGDFRQHVSRHAPLSSPYRLPLTNIPLYTSHSLFSISYAQVTITPTTLPTSFNQTSPTIIDDSQWNTPFLQLSAGWNMARPDQVESLNKTEVEMMREEYGWDRFFNKSISWVTSSGPGCYFR